jgi:hypothetical protein
MARNVVRSDSNSVWSAMLCGSAGVLKPSLRQLHRNKKTNPSGRKWFSLSAALCIVIVALLLCGLSIVYVYDASTIASPLLLLDEQQWHRTFVEKPLPESVKNLSSRSAKNKRTLSDMNTTDASLLGCLTEECIEAMASSIARAFPLRDNRSSWCYTTPVQKEESDRGILLIKVPKGASSTSAGVAIRIAARQSCTQVQWRHRLASEAYFHPDESLVFTTVREPASRAISSIFFHLVSRTNVKVTDAFMIRQLQTHTHPHFGAISNGQAGFQLRYITFDPIPEFSAWTPERPEHVVHPERVLDHVRLAIQTYHFIIVPERMDESLVALALLLNIDVGDVLVSSSKVAGTSQYHLLHPNQTTFTCMPTTRSFVSPGVAQYLQSNQWRAMNYGDYLLHAAASKSLDLTIHNTIGYERFQRALDRYHKLQELEQIYCAPYVQFPCSNDGKPQLQEAKGNCYLYYYDFGCGYPCINSIIHEHDNAQS